MEISKGIISILNEIESEHADFFKEKGIEDHIANGIFMSSYFMNPELPPEILRKIHKAINEFNYDHFLNSLSSSVQKA